MDALQLTLSGSKTDSAGAKEGCASDRTASTSLSYPPILPRIDAPPVERGGPGPANEGVLDAASFDAINHARTRIGRAALYRSPAKLPPDGVLARNKQEELFAFRRYAKICGGDVVPPEIVDADRVAAALGFSRNDVEKHWRQGARAPSSKPLMQTGD